jgi:2-C-methyl-D-erythritol 4-phosphate cytidylyltransferase
MPAERLCDPRCFALIAAAGASIRFGAAEPKQYAMIDEVPLLARTIDALRASTALETVFVVIADDDLMYRERVGEIAGVVPLRCGGRTRAESVRNGLAAIATMVAADDWMLVHDAARPCIDLATLNRLMHELASEQVGGLLAMPLTDTLKRSESGADVRSAGTEPRAGLWCAQTPQMFRYAVLTRAFGQADLAAITDEAQAVEALGLKPRLIRGSATNIKVTYPEDLDLAAAIFAMRPRRRA